MHHVTSRLWKVKIRGCITPVHDMPWDMAPNSVKHSFSLSLSCTPYSCIYAWFQTSAAKWMRTRLFWVITQRVVVISYRRFGTTYRFHLSAFLVFIFYPCSSLLNTTRNIVDWSRERERRGVNTAPILKFSVLFTVQCTPSSGVKRFNGFWIAFHYSQAASNLCSIFLLSANSSLHSQLRAGNSK